MKKSTLAEGLKVAAGKSQQSGPVEQQQLHVERRPVDKKVLPATVLIGGHFSPEVRRTLLLVQAEQENTGKNLKQLLGEAINDLCAKYGKPQPYSGEE
jgi:hypothetical protein